jgi:hypothetical protein
MGRTYSSQLLAGAIVNQEGDGVRGISAGLGVEDIGAGGRILKFIRSGERTEEAVLVVEGGGALVVVGEGILTVEGGLFDQGGGGDVQGGGG